jgi:excisionase family DNA binding protein
VSDITRTTPLADLPELLTADEAAIWCNVKKGRIYDAIRCETLPSVRFGKIVRILRSGLEAFVKGAQR